MDPTQIAALLNGLGVAGPLVGFLIWSLRENTKERQLITSQFLNALQTTITTATTNQAQLSRLIGESVSSIQMMERRNSEDHVQIVKVLETVRERLHALGEHLTRQQAREHMATRGRGDT